MPDSLAGHAGRVDSALVAPSAALQDCIRAYYWHDLRPAGPLSFEQRLTLVPPGPYHGLVWLLDGRALLVECGGQPVQQELPRCFVASAHRFAYRSMAITPYCSFGMAFQPGALALLTGLDVGSRVDAITEAGACLPADWTEWLEAVPRAPHHAERIACCERFLAPRWAKAAAQNRGWVGLIAQGWRRQARVGAIGLLNWTQRHLQRRTRQLVGLTPVEVDRLLRLERALLDFRDGRASRAEVAADHGYADQPHFTREVRQVYRRSPGELRQRLDDPEAQGDWLLRLSTVPPPSQAD